MLAGMMDRFVYLQVGLSIVLVFVGAKFLVSDIVGKVPIWVSLPFITTVVLVSILASLWRTHQMRSDEFGSPRERQEVE